MIKGYYTIKKVSELLDISITSLRELTCRMNMHVEKGCHTNRIIRHSDFIYLSKLVFEIKEDYGNVTLKTINKYFEQLNAK